jgi:hypothetical protein
MKNELIRLDNAILNLKNKKYIGKVSMNLTFKHFI